MSKKNKVEIVKNIVPEPALVESDDEIEIKPAKVETIPEKKIQKRNYVYTEARQKAVEKMMAKKAENAKLREIEREQIKKLERDEIEAKILKKAESVKSRKKKVIQEILESSSDEEEIIIRRKPKKVIYESESSSEDEIPITRSKKIIPQHYEPPKVVFF